MANLSRVAAAMRRLDAVATVTREYRGADVPAAVQLLIDELLAEFPGLGTCKEYLDFLAHGGGAHISNARFSLGIHGFEGYVVSALSERALLDQERYFLFAELLLLEEDEEIFFFFDLGSRGGDFEVPVCWRTVENPVYVKFSDSFGSFLERCAEGDLNIPGEVPK